MSGFEITGAGAQTSSKPNAKPFELKEGTTFEEVQKYGTAKQKSTFMIFDNYDGILDKEEAEEANSYSSEDVDAKEIRERELNYKKLASLAKKFKSYGVDVSYTPNFVLPLIKSVSTKIINGIKTLVIDTKNYTLSLPVNDAKGIRLCRPDDCEDYFIGLNNATVSTKGGCYTFNSSNAKINCTNGKKDWIEDGGNSKLTITTDEKGDEYLMRGGANINFELSAGTTTYDTRGDKRERLLKSSVNDITKITDKNGNVKYYSQKGEQLDIKNIENVGKQRKKVTYNDDRVEYYSHDGKKLKPEYVKNNP